MIRRHRRLVGIGLALVAVALQVTVAQAHLSNPSGDPWFWADASGGPIRNVTFNIAGTFNWNANSKDRFVAAVDQWDSRTDWNPQSSLTMMGADCWASNTCHGVYLDGSDPAGAFGPGVLAYNRIKRDHKQDPIDNTWYWDIKDSDITFNVNAYSFWFGAAQNPAGTYDLQGVMTHELGHAIYLIDLTICDAAPNRETMCGSVSSANSFDARTLAADDITSANRVY